MILRFRLRFVVPDPIKVERYGLPQAMMDQLMRKVFKNLSFFFYTLK